MNSETTLKLFEEKLAAQNYASNTIRAYKDYINVYLKSLKESQNIAEVNLTDLSNFIKHKVEVEGISASYQKGLVGAIKKFYKIVFDKDFNVEQLYPKKRGQILPSYFTKSEIKSLLSACKNIKHKAILMTIYSCGLRLSELLNLKNDALHANDGKLFIEASKRTKARYLPIPDKLSNLLEEYLVKYKPKEYLFEGSQGGIYTERSVQLLLKKTLKQANITTPGTVNTLRHSYAIHLIQSGVAIKKVKELLGHDSIKTTQIYMQIINKDKTTVPSPLDFL